MSNDNDINSEKGKKSSLAYKDVMERNGPSMSHDPEYMAAYRTWENIQFKNDPGSACDGNWDDYDASMR